MSLRTMTARTDLARRPRRAPWIPARLGSGSAPSPPPPAPSTPREQRPWRPCRPLSCAWRLSGQPPSRDENKGSARRTSGGTSRMSRVRRRVVVSIAGASMELGARGHLAGGQAHGSSDAVGRQVGREFTWQPAPGSRRSPVAGPLASTSPAALARPAALVDPGPREVLMNPSRTKSARRGPRREPEEPMTEDGMVPTALLLPFPIPKRNAEPNPGITVRRRPFSPGHWPRSPLSASLPAAAATTMTMTTMQTRPCRRISRSSRTSRTAR